MQASVRGVADCKAVDLNRIAREKSRLNTRPEESSRHDYNGFLFVSRYKIKFKRNVFTWPTRFPVDQTSIIVMIIHR